MRRGDRTYDLRLRTTSGLDCIHDGLRRDALDRVLTRRIDIGDVHLICEREGFAKLLGEQLCPREAVGLEGHH